MKCNEISDILSLYIDNELSKDEKDKIENHLLSCKDCQKELEEYKKVISAVQNLPEVEPPEGYCSRLHEKLLYARQSNEKPPKIVSHSRFRWMKYASIAAALVLVLLVGSMNNFGLYNLGMKKSESSYDYSNMETTADNESGELRSPRAVPEEAPEMYYGEIEKFNDVSGKAIREVSDGYTMAASVKEKEMKIIKSGTISAQTENYNNFLSDLTIKLSSIGGFLESNNTEVYQVYDGKKLMYGNIIVRMPQENFYDLVEYLEEVTEVRRKNINERDVTKEYYEKDNKVKNLEIQEEHLRELFEKAVTVEEMLLIENELRRVRTEIDALNISLSDIDDRSAMSTINLEIEEIMTSSLTLKTKDGVWDRSKNGFIDTVNGIIRTLENLLIYLVSNSPILIPAIIICIVGFLKIRKYWKPKR